MQRLNPEFITLQLPLLDPPRYAALCNDLIVAAAASAGIHPSHLSLNLNVSDPDGGLDARCIDAPRVVGRIIPAATCGYQFRSGRTARTVREVAKEDIYEKPRVKELLEAGHPFVYLAATDHGDAFEGKVAEQVRSLGLAVLRGQIIVISGHALAQQLRAYPSRVARFFGLDVDLVAFEDWSGRRSMRNPYQADESVSRRLAELSHLISQPSSRTRVVGAPGDGKTRTVLEALRNSPLEGEVLYADQAELLTPSVTSYLRTTQDVRCTLVVDEVDDAAAYDLLERYSVMPPGVRLVMIGLDASGRPQPDTLQVEGLSQGILVAAIEAIAVGIPHPTAEEIARVCEHSPKLAVLIAGRVKAEPELANHHQRLADRQIQGVLDNYLPIAREDWRALSTVALLERVGWTREAEEESRIVFEAVGLDVGEAREVVDRLHRSYGIAPVAGRLRYVSPQMLADHLAARLIGTWTAADLRRFLGALTTPMAESFARRMRGLSSVLANRETVEEVILGNQGPFRHLEDLEDGSLSILLRYLAGPFPQGTLRALRRIIDGASEEVLREATEVRRDLVWALEELLWPEATFSQAAHLLLRLAIAENEAIGNNATGVFVESFQMLLGRTAAGPEQRLRVLQEAIGSDDPSARILAARALGQAITISHIHRMGGPPTDIPGMPADSWKPATYGELWRATSACVVALRPLLNDPDVAVKVKASEALSKGVEAAIQLPGVLEAWGDAAKRLVSEPYEVRRPVLTTLEWRLEREAADAFEGHLPEDAPEDEKAEIRNVVRRRFATLRELFSELKGTDFSSRFRWALSSDPWKPSLRPGSEGGGDLERAQKELAAEGLDRPELLDAEWDWLLNVPGHMPEVWIERLATLDSQEGMWDRLLNLSRRHERAIGWVSLYYLARHRITGDSGRFDEEAERIAQAGTGPLQLFDLLVRAGYSPGRLQRLVGLFKDGFIDGRLFGRLTFSTWRENLPPQDAEKLVQAVLASPEGQDAAVSFLSFYLHFAPEGADSLWKIALQVLNQTVEHGEPKSGTLDEWSEVAKHIVKSDPYGTTSAVLRRLELTERFLTEGLTEVLREAWRVGDKRRLFEGYYAARIERRNVEGWKLRAQLERFPFHEAGDEYLVSWVAEKPETRAYALAQLIGRPVGTPSTLHAALLDRFPDHGVGNAFFSDFVSGTWWGSASERTRGLIHEATQWLEDERPVVQEWAQGVVRSLEEMLQVDETRDAEERFR